MWGGLKIFSVCVGGSKNFFSLHISLNVCHLTSHHPPPSIHPTPLTNPHDPSIPHQPPTPPHPCIPMHPYTYPPMFVMLLHTTHPTSPMPSHASLHISPNVCHVTSQQPPTPPMPSHASLHISLNVCHVTSHHPPQPINPTPPTNPYDPSISHHPPTPPHPHIPMHPYTYLPMFVMLLHNTHPTPPMPSHASLHISPNVCHVASHPIPTLPYT